MLAEALDTFRDNAAFPVTTHPLEPDEKGGKGERPPGDHVWGAWVAEAGSLPQDQDRGA